MRSEIAPRSGVAAARCVGYHADQERQPAAGGVLGESRDRGVDVAKIARLSLPCELHDPAVGECRALDRERLRSEPTRRDAIGA